MTRTTFLTLAATSALGLAALSISQRPADPTFHLNPANARAIDGDTLRLVNCSAQPTCRLRLADIDAPELPGHCRPGRQCQPGDPFLAQAALADLLSHGITCTPDSHEPRDYYGRWYVHCLTASGKDVSQLLLDGGVVGHYRRSPKP